MCPDSVPGSSQLLSECHFPSSLSALAVDFAEDLLRSCVNEQLVSDGEPAASK